MKKYIRAQLIKLCENAIVNVSEWSNRDTHSSQKQVGELWACLKAGCAFEIRTNPDSMLCSNEDTLWITYWAPGFNEFENGFSLDDRSTLYHEIVCLPTQPKLDSLKGKDWY